MTTRLLKDAKFWDRAARKYSTSSIEDQAGYDRTIAAVRRRIKPEDCAIELGCGTGTTALNLAPQLKQINATDVSAQMIQIAREKSEKAGCHHVFFSVADSRLAEQPDAAYDVAFAFNVLHLVPSLGETLLAVNRVLKPGGLLISKTPCLRLMHPAIHFAIPVMQAVGKAPTVSILAPEQIEKALLSARFEVIESAWHGTRSKDIRPYFVAQKS